MAKMIYTYDNRPLSYLSFSFQFSSFRTKIMETQKLKRAYMLNANIRVANALYWRNNDSCDIL